MYQEDLSQGMSILSLLPFLAPHEQDEKLD